MTDPASPLGAWRLTARRLGGPPGPGADDCDALAELDAGGAVTVVVAGRSGNPGVGAWRSAGADRFVLVVEWFVADDAGPVAGRLVVRAAVELSQDGRRCSARLLGQRFDPDGRALHLPTPGEASGVRIEP